MNELFGCNYKLTKKHINQSRRHTLLKVKRLDRVIYILLGVCGIIVTIGSIMTGTFLQLIVSVAMVYFCLIKNFIKLINYSRAIPQEDVYPGEKYVAKESISFFDGYFTYYPEDAPSETVEISRIKHLGITEDTFTLYIDGRKNIIIPQYSFITGTKRDFVEFIKSKGISISGKLYN